MATLTSSLFLIAMGIWLGGVVFFSFFTAPVIFRRLARVQATDLISVIFPSYYRLGYVCGSVMLIAGAYPIFRERDTLPGWTAELIAMLATGLSVYAAKVVMPRVSRFRSTAQSAAGTPAQSEARRLHDQAHQLSMTLNLTVLLLLLAEAVLYGWRVRVDFLG